MRARLGWGTSRRIVTVKKDARLTASGPQRQAAIALVEPSRRNF